MRFNDIPACQITEGIAILRNQSFNTVILQRMIPVLTALPSKTPSSTQKPNPILIGVCEPTELTSTGIIPSAVAVPLTSQPDTLFLTPEEFKTYFGYPKPGARKGRLGMWCFTARQV